MTTPQQFVVRDIREAGWFHVDNELIDKFGQQLGAYGVALYAVLARYCKNSTQQVNLSQRDIAATLGISQSRIRASLGDLVESGLIHVEVPERPSPGIISTITMLKVKATERNTLSSTAELSATRARNKEVKTKTETNTSPPLLLEGFDFELPRARERDEQYSQEDFDERDFRSFCAAGKKLQLKLDNGWGSDLTRDQIFEHQCFLAGLPVKRGLEVEKRAMQWPQGASA